MTPNDFWFRFFEAAARDLRHAVRSLRRSPSFTLCAVLTLALGIGANTAMFTLADAVLFRPLPVPAPQRLLRIDTTDPTDAARQARPTPGAVVDAIRAAHIFAGVCGFLTPLTTVDMQGRMASVSAVVTSGNCFETLGVRPALGRLTKAYAGERGLNAFAAVDRARLALEGNAGVKIVADWLVLQL